MSPAYKFLGGSHIYGVRSILPKYQKIRGLEKINSDLFSRPKVSQLSEVQVDKLVFVATNMPPTTALKHLKVVTKQDFRSMMVRENASLMGVQPQRFVGLQWNLSNVDVVANAVGWRDIWEALLDDGVGA